jgi:uncharacterized protein (DUF983 family)
MNMNALLGSVFIGSIGLGLFIYGKKQRRAPHLLVGLALMVYPYFVSSVTLMFVIAGALGGLLYFAKYVGL